MHRNRKLLAKFSSICGKIIPGKSTALRSSSSTEKPEPDKAPTNLAVIGRYILTPDIFDILRETKPGKNGEVQLTDAIMTQAKHGCVMAYKFKGRRFDCGSVHGFIEATNYCYENIYMKDK